MTQRTSCGPAWLDAKLAAGKIIVIDGATGTELEARGVPMDEKVWSGVALKSHADTVRETHADYIRAGAEVIITNTFSCGRHQLDISGLGDEVAAINRTGVEVAKQARDETAEHPVAIAGSMCEWVSLTSDWCDDTERQNAAYREQADVLAEAGVDLLAIEMSSHPVRGRLMAEAAVATGLPVWLGVSCKVDDDSGAVVGYDEPHADFTDFIGDLSSIGVAVINVMHTAIKDTPAGIEAVKQHWTGPIGVYPESGYFIMPNWQFVDIIAPDDLVDEARGWIAAGAQILGGCCGLSVPHVRALKEAFA